MTQNTERVEFEAHLIRHMPHANLDFDGEGYSSPWEQAAWTGWKFARRAPAAQVPQGWKLVPESLTQDMAEAAKVVDGRLSVWKYNDAFKAMLAAAPQPPAAQVPDGWPTNAMIEAGRRAAETHGPLIGNGQSLWHIFRDMLAAAPQPPETRKPLAPSQRDTIKAAAWRETRDGGYWDTDSIIDGTERTHGITGEPT